MTNGTTRNGNETPPQDDYAAWLKRLLKIALAGGPQVVSARAMAEKYRHLDDLDLQATALIRDTRRGMFYKSMLKHVRALLVSEGILKGDEAQWIALARWFVHVRLATAIALIYGHDPEPNWVQAAILVSIDRDPVQEELDAEEEAQGRTLWDGLLQSLSDDKVKRWITLALPSVLKKLRPSPKSAAIILVLWILYMGREPLLALRHAQRCRRTGKTARRIFRFRGLPSTTDKAVAH